MENAGQMSESDLSEMLGLAYMSQEAGFPKLQMNSEHAIEILERLLAFIRKEGAH